MSERPDTGRRVLVLFAHPALEKSRVNRVLARAARGLPGVTFHDLYEDYPELDICVTDEQRLLAGHEVVVMQHPLYWYSTPAMLKEWQDLVLEHGWAYGRGGDALRGKLLLNAVTAGGGQEAYSAAGRNRHTVRQLLVPIAQTAQLCGMRYLAPFVVHGTHSLTAEQIDAAARDYRRLLEGLRDDRLDLDRAEQLQQLGGDATPWRQP